MRITRFAAGAVALVTALAIAGCSSPNTTSSSSPSSSDSTPADTQPVTLEISWWGDSTRAGLFNQVVQNFEAKYPNITVTQTPVAAPTDLFNRLDTDFGAGGSTAPDVFALGGAYPQTYATAGQLLELDSADISGIVNLDKYPTSTLSSGTVDGKVYALPTGGNATAMFINTDIMQQAGVTLPTGQWTWDDLVNIANQVGKAGLKNSAGQPVYGLDLRIADILGTYLGQISQYGLYTPDGKIGVTPDQVAQWYTIEQNLSKGGGLPDPSIVTQGVNLSPDQQLFTLGQAGITFGYSNLATSYNKGGTIQILTPPTDTSNSGVSLLPSAFWAINASTKHPTEAAELLNWFLNEPTTIQIITDTRGVPFNPDMAAVSSQTVTGDAAKSDAYVGSVLASGVIAPNQPNGGGNMNQYAQNGESDVLFNKATPAQAAATFLTNLQKDLDAAG
ncbi:MAG: extracellular solute-binding protein [Propionibacteriaceae bacterium]|nr:extracellular solute-binding protein [Propionibacteriaceae bacterium]